MDIHILKQESKMRVDYILKSKCFLENVYIEKIFDKICLASCHISNIIENFSHEMQMTIKQMNGIINLYITRLCCQIRQNKFYNDTVKYDDNRIYKNANFFESLASLNNCRYRRWSFQIKEICLTRDMPDSIANSNDYKLENLSPSIGIPSLLYQNKHNLDNEIYKQLIKLTKKEQNITVGSADSMPHFLQSASERCIQIDSSVDYARLD